MSSAIVALQRSGASPELAALPLLRFVILLGGLRVRQGGPQWVCYDALVGTWYGI